MKSMANPNDPTADEAPDEELVAYLDGELEDAAAREIEQKIANDPIARTKTQSLKKTYDLLDYLPRPEPSADFATKTVTQILPYSQPSTSHSSINESIPRPRIAWPWLSIAAAFSIVIGLAIGLITRTPSTKELPLTPDLLPLLSRLSFYNGVDDLEFLRKLDRPDLFGDDAEENHAVPVRLDRTISTELQTKQLEQFKKLSPARRQDLVTLDKQIRELTDMERARLGHVLEEYAIWLDRLPDGLRKEVLDAPNPSDRIKAIETVQIKEWQETLPTDKREKLRVTIDPNDKATLIQRWIESEKERKQEWQLAARQWQTIKERKKPWPFYDNGLKAEVEQYVKTVLKTDSATTRLNPSELTRLNGCRSEIDKDAGWLQYGGLLLELSERHPSLPESRNGKHVTNPDQIPMIDKQLRNRLPAYNKNILPTVGRWPDYALAVINDVRGQKLATLPSFGPCRPGEFTIPVDDFLTGKLIPQLNANQLSSLKALEGRWPEYPRKMMDLARQMDLSVPGVTLPGQPKLWQQYYRYTPPKPEKPVGRVTAN